MNLELKKKAEGIKQILAVLGGGAGELAGQRWI
jgi:hypothetical protein